MADPKKRRLRVYLAVSLDGYIATEEGGVGWLDPYRDAAAGFGELMKQISASIMGRTTYDHAMKMGSSVGGSKAKPTYVLTHRKIEPLPKGVVPWSGEPAALLREIDAAAAPGDTWLMGGGKAILPFHEAGLIDRWELAIVPVVLGKGIPLFLSGRRGLASLSLVDTKTYGSGVVSVTYEPAPEKPRAPKKRSR